jgi:alkylhydroperoxidase family enzyme
VMAVLLEESRQPVTVGHWSRSLAAWCHHTDTWHPADVTWRSVGTGRVDYAIPSDRSARGCVRRGQGDVRQGPGGAGIRGELHAGVQLPARRAAELATVAAATAIRSSYCSLVHGNILATGYYPAEQVVSIAGDGDETAAALDAADAALVRFARKVAEEAEQITPEDVGELRRLGLSDADIFNVILAAAARCFFSKVLDATGTLPDAALHDLPDQLRTALTVGRDIAPRA